MAIFQTKHEPPAYLPSEPELWRTIVIAGKGYQVYSHIVMENDFYVRRRFTVRFPDNSLHRLDVAQSLEAMQDLPKMDFDGMILSALTKEIEATLPVKPEMPAFTIKAKPIDFSEIEAKMFASMSMQAKVAPETGEVTPQGPMSLTFHALASASEKAAKSLKAVSALYTKALEKLMGRFVKVEVEKMDKETVFKVLYGGEPASKPVLTEKGLATLERFGVKLEG